MECPPCARYTENRIGRGPFYGILIFCGETQTQTKENKFATSDNGKCCEGNKTPEMQPEYFPLCPSLVSAENPLNN